MFTCAINLPIFIHKQPPRRMTMHTWLLPVHDLLAVKTQQLRHNCYKQKRKRTIKTHTHRKKTHSLSERHACCVELSNTPPSPPPVTLPPLPNSFASPTVICPLLTLPLPLFHVVILFLCWRRKSFFE